MFYYYDRNSYFLLQFYNELITEFGLFNILVGIKSTSVDDINACHKIFFGER